MTKRLTYEQHLLAAAHLDNLVYETIREAKKRIPVDSLSRLEAQRQYHATMAVALKP